MTENLMWGLKCIGCEIACKVLMQAEQFDYDPKPDLGCLFKNQPYFAGITTKIPEPKWIDWSE